MDLSTFSTSRRHFFRRAALTGAAAWVGGRLPLLAAEQGGATAGAEPEIVPLAPPDKQPPKLHLPEPAPRKVGWAIVGLGQLSLEQIMPAFPSAYLSKPVALVSGHPEKAKKVAATYGVGEDALYSYENFDKIADDPRIEVVYIVLPNSMHAEFTMRALKAGKHVLCEKPMSDKIEDAEKMVAAAEEAKRKLMIAYRLHYEPMTQTAMALLQERAYGRPKTFSSSNTQNVEAPNIRLSKTLGGGPLGDIGIYSINTARYLLGEDPIEVSGMAFQSAEDPRFREVPETVSFTMRFPSGALAACDCSFGSTESRRWRMHCEKGFLEMDPAFSYKGLRLRVKDGGTETKDTKQTELVIPEVNQFTKEMDHFSQCVLEGSDPQTPGAEGLADLRVIAAIEESIRSGKTITVARPKSL